MGKIYYFYTLSASDDPKNVRYVGVTSLTVNRRFIGHKYCAMHPEKRGLPVHKWMYSKYEQGLTIIPTQIDSCDEEEWESKEQYWIKYYKEQGYNLMNLDKGGRGVITKERRSKSSIERSIENKRKAVIALNLDGTFYKEFPSIREATRDLNLGSMQAIFNVLHGLIKSVGGYMWVFKEDYDPNKEYSYKKEYKSTKIYQFDTEGNLINSFDSKADVLKYLNIKGYGGLTKALDNKIIYRNFYWGTTEKLGESALTNNYKYKITLENKEVLYFKMRKEVEAYLNVSGSFVTNMLHKHNPWIYNNKIIEAI